MSKLAFADPSDPRRPDLVIKPRHDPDEKAPLDMQGNFGMLLGGLAMVTKNKSAAWLGSIAAISGFLNNLGNLGQSTGSPINGLMMSLLSLVMLYLPQVLDVAAAPVSRPSS